MEPMEIRLHFYYVSGTIYVNLSHSCGHRSDLSTSAPRRHCPQVTLTCDAVDILDPLTSSLPGLERKKEKPKGGLRDERCGPPAPSRGGIKADRVCEGQLAWAGRMEKGSRITLNMATSSDNGMS